MARTTGAIGFKTKQKYLHEKFPDQGWMDETDKKVINEHYKAIHSHTSDSLSPPLPSGECSEATRKVLDELTQQAQELKMGY